MSPALFLAGAMALVTALPPDAVEQAVGKMSGPMWKNGTYPVIHLSKDATTQQVVAKVLAGRKYEILETRHVLIEGGGPGSDVYAAVLVETGFHKQVVLLQYDGSWWSRVVDVD